MKTLIASLSCIALVLSCSTPVTIETRKSERAAAYAGLSSEEQIAVDQGRLREGMNTNACYIAWGRPTRIISEGPTTTWLYEVSELKEHKSTTVRSAPSRGPGSVSAFTEETGVLYPQLLVRAKILFTNGFVKEWWRIERPAY
jgi:hypothetical protein